MGIPKKKGVLSGFSGFYQKDFIFWLAGAKKKKNYSQMQWLQTAIIIILLTVFAAQNFRKDWDKQLQLVGVSDFCSQIMVGAVIMDGGCPQIPSGGEAQSVCL